MERRVHRLTPIIRGWGIVFALAAIALVNGLEPLFTWARDGNLGAAVLLRGLGVFVAGLLVFAAVSQLWWAKMGFGLGEEEVGVTRGVVTNHVRTVRYDRIQAVDVVEPLVARIFGLAAVRVEAAGGGDSAVEIAYVPKQEAEELRAEIMHAVAREGGGAESGAGDADHDDDATDYLVEPVPIRRTLIGAALQLGTIAAAVVVAIPLLTDLTAGAAVVVLVGAVPPLWRMIDQSWRFHSVQGGESSEVLTVTYGLANRRRQLVPLERIHAVSLTQPPLWRLLGWWEVKVNVAGYKIDGDGGTLTLLPVGTLDQALAVVDALSPLDAPAFEDLDPASATVDVRSPRRARWVSPLDYARQSLTMSGADAVVVTWGRVSRRFAVVEAPHIQELTLKQGPLQRAAGLASVRLDLVPGPVSATVRDVDEGEARRVVDTLRGRVLPG
ncbi:putative membrane protein [Corynebacterium timonense]|uniref:Putative membrane protein n=1 Tax=Corynebacterium timonense TaxID=441500 RepID=A0A1H1SCD1_9CORY|nr:putative membrane protein [Corynebacterium timonense]